MKEVKFSNARAQLTQIIKDALAGEKTVLTKYGKAVAIVVPAGFSPDHAENQEKDS